MAKLSEGERHRLPAGTFGLPETRGFPMPDKEHARLAISGATRALHAGHITQAQKARIDAKAERILKHGK